MPRPLVIVLGVVLWTSFALVAIAHWAVGDPAGPIMAVLIVGTGVVLYHANQAAARAERDATLATDPDEAA